MYPGELSRCYIIIMLMIIICAFRDDESELSAAFIWGTHARAPQTNDAADAVADMDGKSHAVRHVTHRMVSVPWPKIETDSVRGQHLRLDERDR